ncbi:MAG: molybdopterin molybdenumtransferase MoeA [Anaerolineaceae bacterium]|nr:molybdopterin molybdenumtransferase MoeA [Anaerolineaceae bacterium]
MPEFLELLPPGQALALMLNHLPDASPALETALAHCALNRVTGAPVVSGELLPAFSRSTVDGYAVRARDTFGASDSLPAYLSLGPETPMGKAPEFSLVEGQASLIHTGGMLPADADAVVMLEHTQATGSNELEVLRAVGEGENTLLPGEDLKVGQEALPGGARLRPPEIGVLMALGIAEVIVVKRPRIGVLSSGDEVVPPQKSPQPGQVRDINSYSLSALIEQAGGEPVQYGIIPDQADTLYQTLNTALQECDAAVITAGSSASTRDLTADVIQKIGDPGVLVHGVSVRPGKPTILAVCKGKAIVGLPGNPVSALVIARLFVAPLIHRLAGLKKIPLQPSVRARLKINLASQAGREDWIPARLIQTDEYYEAEPIFFKSNLIFTLAQADGLIYIPADVTGFSAGNFVKVEFL